MFVDPDDWLLDDAVQKLHNALLVNNSDIVIANYMEFNEKNNNYFLHVFDKDYFVKNYKPLEWMKNIYNTRFDINQLFESSWGKLYKKKLWEHLRFPIQVHLSEDEFVMWKIYLTAKRITYINIPVTTYRQHAGSLVHVQPLTAIISLSNAETRIALLSHTNANYSVEIDGYKWRLHLHYNDDLKNARLNTFYDAAAKISILKKYGKL